jgi:uroporphyrinogen decarboxylase
MNSRQRVLTALERKTPDRVPTFELLIDSQVMDAILPGADLLSFVETLGLDAVAVRPDIQREKIGEELFRDERGLLLRRTTQDYREPVSTVINSLEDLRRFEFPDPYAPHRFESLQKAVARFRGRLPVIAFLRDGWSEVRDLHGFAESLIDLHDNPDLIRGIIEKAVDYYCEMGRLAAGLGVEIALAGDDIAGNNGLFMSPRHFHEIIYPAMKRLYASWHRAGLYIIKHSDGNLNPILDLLVDTGLDCLHPIDPLAGMSLEKVKREYGQKICIMGNVNCAGRLVFGAPEQVVAEVKHCIDVAAPGGGYICSSSNSIPRSVKPENYRAMIETVKQYGRYPHAPPPL